MKNLKKYITLNLLSISGYIFLALVLVFIFYIYPEAINYDRHSHEDAAYGFGWAILLAIGTFFIYTFIELMAAAALILEFLIYKLRKTQPQIINIPEKYNRAHTILLAIGILLSTLPIIGGMYFLLQPV